MAKTTTIVVSPGMRKMLRGMKTPSIKRMGVWRIVINLFTRAVGENFDAEGRPAWQALDPEYAARKHATFTLSGKRSKRKRKARAKSHKILQLSQHLRKAAQGSRSHGFYTKATGRWLKIGIRGIPYARIQNDGGVAGRGAQIPSRPYFRFKDGKPAMTKAEWKRLLEAMHTQMVNYLLALKGR